MTRTVAALTAGVLFLAFAAYAKLPTPTAEEKSAAAAKAEKQAAEKAKAAKALEKAQDRAAGRYGKYRGGADHSKAGNPDAELTRREAQTEMPKPGQANDHSTTARDPKTSSRR